MDKIGRSDEPAQGIDVTRTIDVNTSSLLDLSNMDITTTNTHIEELFCSYCNKSLYFEDKNGFTGNVTGMRLEDEDTGETRHICVTCMIKAFDKLLGKE